MEPQDHLPQHPGHRLRIGAIGLTLCLGLWACGDKGSAAHDETASAATPAATAPPVAETTDPASAAVSDLEPPPMTSGPLPHAVGRGTSKDGHLVLTGNFTADKDAFVTCAAFPGNSFQISLAIGDSPTIVLVLENFHGAGDYDAESRLRADYFGEGIRQSRGKAKAKIEVAPPTGTETRSVISGSFTGTYNGEAGKGTISAKFDKCLYELPKVDG
ncbi:MAG TPA: hypothetical protein VN851_16550 [Thermoanaerobaculia bacterium]|nr:hypothetical protein [Thermoanaerobaculia bacterium]